MSAIDLNFYKNWKPDPYHGLKKKWQAKIPVDKSAKNKPPSFFKRARGGGKWGRAKRVGSGPTIFEDNNKSSDKSSLTTSVSKQQRGQSTKPTSSKSTTKQKPAHQLKKFSSKPIDKLRVSTKKNKIATGSSRKAVLAKTNPLSSRTFGQKSTPSLHSPTPVTKKNLSRGIVANTPNFMSPADMMVCSPGSPDNQTMVIDECTPVQKVDENQPTIILQSSLFKPRKQLNTNLFGSHNFLEDDTDQQSKEMDFTMCSCSTGHDDTIMEGNSLVGNTLNFDTPEVAAPDTQFNNSNPPKDTSAALQRHPSNMSDNNTVVIQIGKRNVFDTAGRASSSSAEATTTFNANINTSSTNIREVAPVSHTKNNHRESGDGKAFFINGNRYSRVKLVGRGGSSKVYKVLDSAGNVFALKRIKMKSTADSAMANQRNEINLLRKLSGKPGIIGLVDAHINIASKTVSVVMEFGETDLSKYVKAKKNKLSLDEVRDLWKQMLEAVQTIHEGRVIHGDLKPANFLFVDGKMKLIDFGISKEIGNDTEHIGRDTQASRGVGGLMDGGSCH